MKTIWALQDAKNRFSELVDHAVQDGHKSSPAGAKRPWSSSPYRIFRSLPPPRAVS